MHKNTSFNRDYKSHRSTPPRSRSGHAKTAALVLTAGLLVFGTAYGFMATGTGSAPAPQSSPQAKAHSSKTTVRPDRVVVPLEVPDAAPPAEDEGQEPEVGAGSFQLTIRAGDTLSDIFARLGITREQLEEVLAADRTARKQLARLVPGQNLEIRIDEDGLVQELLYQVDEQTSLVIMRENGVLRVSAETRNFETRVTFSKGVIRNSLFETGRESGLSDRLIVSMAEIFRWDIDFALDIRAGDSFVVMYEERYLDGRKVADGNILAAEFINQDKSFKAIRYTDASGRSDYYSPEGQNLRKAFLRTPVDFARISSGFGKRLHPVLNRLRLHKGVDYSAAAGTPIRAAGNGRVAFRGVKGGYGKTVIIQHGKEYSTLYAHMQRFAPSVRLGQRVRQGQLIGYVGSTGLATGPHLHYEFRVNGVHRNPLTIKLPNAAPISAKFKADFQTAAQILISQLNLIGGPTRGFSAL